MRLNLWGNADSVDNERNGLSPLQPVGIPRIRALDSDARIDFPLQNALSTQKGSCFFRKPKYQALRVKACVA